MQPRREMFSDRVQYFFDCAQEGCDIDWGSAIACELYGDEARIAEIIDAPGEHEPQSHYLNRRRACLRLVAMADEIIERLPPELRAGLAHNSLHYVSHGVAELAETMSWWTIEDEIDGGCMEGYRDRPRSRDGLTNKRTARRLLSPRFIRRCVKKHAATEADHLRDLSAVAVRRAARTTPKPAQILAEIRRAQIAAAQPRHDRMMAMALPDLHKPVSREQRKVIRRSLNVATSLLGADAVGAFLRGDAVRLIGVDGMLVVRKRGRLAARGHGCLSVALASTDGTTLADLCTYIEDTPTLDQLCGFALWMRAGEERAIMETANIVKLAEGAADNALVRHHYDVRREAALRVVEDASARVRDIITGRVVRTFQLSHEQKRERSRAYWERTKDHWTGALRAAVIGHRNFHVYRNAGAFA